MSDLFQREVAHWHNEAFGYQNIDERMKKLREEFNELQRAVDLQEDVGDECADIYIVLAGICNLYGIGLESMGHRKLQVNKFRTWKQQSDGTYKHVDVPCGKEEGQKTIKPPNSFLIGKGD